MDRLERILVVVDRGMRTTPALRRGIDLARRASASLQLCLFDHHPLIDATADIVHPEVMRLAKTRFIEERERWLAREAATLAEHGLRVDCEVRWAPLQHKALLDRVLEHRPDIVVKDLGLDGAAPLQLLAPSDARTVRYCPAPLMLVRPQSAQLPRRIAAAVDTSGDTDDKQPLNDAVVRAALQLGLYSDAEVHLAHVFPFRPLPASEQGLETAYEDMRALDAQTFQAFAERHSVPDDRRHLLAGEPAPTLAGLTAHARFELLAIGAVYRSAFDRFFLGSTAEALLAQAACDVLVIKPPRFLDELRRSVDIDTLRKRQALLQLDAQAH